MKFEETKLKGLYIIETEPKTDNRGYLMRTFCEEEFRSKNIKFKLVQVNKTLTKKKGTIRGMHFQKEPKAEKKIVQCLQGIIYDVIVDLRKKSPTYCQWIAIKLTADSRKMIMIPEGFAHGFQALTDNCELQYFMSEYYSPDFSSGVLWNDLLFDIKWPLKNPFLSEKDKSWPLLKK